MKRIFIISILTIILMQNLSVNARTLCDCFGSCVYIHPRDVNTQTKQYIKERDGYNKYSKVDVDHMIPLCMGGTNDPTNLQALTKKEHERKTNNDMILLNYINTCLMTIQEAQNEAKNWKKAK